MRGRGRPWILAACIILGLLVITIGPCAVTGFEQRRAVRDMLQRLESEGKPTSLAEMIPPLVPEEDNAAGLYLQFAELTQPHELISPDPAAPLGLLYNSQPVSYDNMDPGEEAHLVYMGAMIRQDTAAFELMDDATGREHCRFDVNWEEGAGALFPHLAKLRHNARVLSTASMVASHEGDQALALKRLRQGFVLSRHVAAEPTTIAQLVTYAIDAIMLRAAEYVVYQGDLPKPQVKELVGELQRTDRFDLERALRWERALGIWVYDQLREDPAQAAQMIGFQDGDVPRAIIMRLSSNQLSPLIWADEAGYLQALGRLERVIGQPWRESYQSCGSYESRPGTLGGLIEHGYLPSTMLLPLMTRTITKRDNTLARRALLQTALGLRIYKQRHGEYAETLSELEQLNWPPCTDVYSGKPLVYRRKGDRFLLYSIGPDLNDDRGRPIYWLLRAPGASGTYESVGGVDVDAGDIPWIWWDDREAVRAGRRPARP